MYVKSLAILLLLLGAFWFGRQTGIDSIKAEQLALISENVKLRQIAETEIVKDRIVYRDRIQKIREVVVQCDLPADLISLLRESGVFVR